LGQEPAAETHRLQQANQDVGAGKLADEDAQNEVGVLQRIAEAEECPVGDTKVEVAP
jgi:hypothetical protein